MQKKPHLLRFSMKQQILFTKRLGMILRSGMSIMDGLSMIRRESNSASSSYIYESIIVDVSNGQSLSVSLQRFERIFGPFCINIIRVGESSGTLYENLEYLSLELKKKQTLKNKVVGALMYPAVILLATIGITLLLTIYIFPKIIPIFQSVKATLPLSTRMLMILSSFLNHWGIEVFFAFIAVSVALYFLMRIARVHLFIDRLLLRLPIFGALSRDYNLTNISRTMGLLLHSNAGIINSIELVAASTHNLAYREVLLQSRERLIKGQNISSQFSVTPHLFPSIFSQMITVGETTGNLSASFKYLSEMYEEEIGEMTKNLATLLEPVLMIVMGLVVGFIAISIITPIYSITQNLQPH